MRIFEVDSLQTEIARLRAQGLIVGLCHGCFDILHTGHIRHLEHARKLCDALFVSVTADRFVNKGPNRPVFPAEERAGILSALRVVQGAVVNEHETSLPLLEKLRPSVYIKGSEYQSNPEAVNANFIAERDYAESLGIEVSFTFEETDSSTRIFNKISSVTV